jgi:hypothetical protein
VYTRSAEQRVTEQALERSDALVRSRHQHDPELPAPAAQRIHVGKEPIQLVRGAQPDLAECGARRRERAGDPAPDAVRRERHGCRALDGDDGASQCKAQRYDAAD